jgi:transcriptional regulator with PAS, ATPase and Fis domain
MRGRDPLLDARGFLTMDKMLLEAKLAFELYNLEHLAIVDDECRPIGVLNRGRIAEHVLSGLPRTTKAVDLADRTAPSTRSEDEASAIIGYETPAVFLVDATGVAISLVTRQSLLKSYLNKLKIANANLLAIIDAIDAALVAVDASGTITYANNTAHEILALCGRIPVIGSALGQYFPHEAQHYLALAQQEKTVFVTTIAGSQHLVRAVPLRGLDPATGAVLVLEDVSEREALKHDMEKAQQCSDILRRVLDIAYDAIVVVDRNGIITMISQAYLNFLQLKEQDAIGRHITEVVENTRLHIVLETGVPEIAELQLTRGHTMIATRIPMISNGEIVGAVGKVLFRDKDDLEAMRNKITRMEEQLELYKGQFNKAYRARFTFANIIGTSRALTEVKRNATRAALSDATLLILGESGVGKEVFAQAIHAHSRRATHPFVRVNCAAIPADLLELEFFGYEEGSFLGARRGGKAGKFEIANGGTLFLDEIADMPLSLQAKILGALQEREVEKIGAETPTRFDVRIIVSSNQDLEERVRLGFLRRDLYYRISAWSLSIPPLRERKEDIPALTKHILDKYIRKYGKYIEGVSAMAMSLLYSYSWPGNVRELENEIERAIGQMDKASVMHPEHLSEKITLGKIERAKTLAEAVVAAEREAILDALRQAANNRAAAAQILGVSRTCLYEKMLKHSLLCHKDAR